MCGWGGSARSGTIPTELGRLEKLDLLMLHYNRLTGTVPAELFSAHGAVVMELSNNRLEVRALARVQ